MFLAEGVRTGLGEFLQQDNFVTNPLGRIVLELNPYFRLKPTTY